MEAMRARHPVGRHLGSDRAGNQGGANVVVAFSLLLIALLLTVGGLVGWEQAGEVALIWSTAVPIAGVATGLRRLMRRRRIGRGL